MAAGVRSRARPHPLARAACVVRGFDSLSGRGGSPGARSWLTWLKYLQPVLPPLGTQAPGLFSQSHCFPLLLALATALGRGLAHGGVGLACRDDLGP